MKSYKHSLIMVALLSFSVASLHARMLDVMIFTGNDETVEGAAISLDFANALCNMSVPIIVSQPLFKVFVEAQEMGAKGEPGYEVFSRSIHAELWESVYSNEDESFLLLIPKAYKKHLNELNNNAFQEVVQKFNKERATNYTVDDVLTGFCLSRLRVLGNFDEVLKSYHAKKVSQTGPFPSGISSMFTQGKEDIFGLFNIYLSGHGMYPQTHDMASKTIAEIDIQDAYIADFSIPDFKRLLQFFTDKIRVNFFYYSTCYAGDYNLVLPYMVNLVNTRGNIMGGLSPNFIIAAGGLTAQEVSANIRRELQACSQGREEKGLVNIRRFFELLHRYGGDTATQRVLYKDEELRDIAEAITLRTTASDDPLGITGLMQVKFPLVDIFRVVATPTIGVISEVLTRKHVQEQSSYDFSNKEAILLYPREIPVPIIIHTVEGKETALVAMQPGVGLHKLEKIEMSGKGPAFFAFLRFIAKFSAVHPAFNKYFYIKEVQFTTEAIGTTAQTTLSVYGVLIYQNATELKLVLTSPDKKRVYFYDYAWGTYDTQLRKTLDVDLDSDFIAALKTYLQDDNLKKELDYDDLQKALTAEEKERLSATQKAVSGKREEEKVQSQQVDKKKEEEQKEKEAKKISEEAVVPATEVIQVSPLKKKMSKKTKVVKKKLKKIFVKNKKKKIVKR